MRRADDEHHASYLLGLRALHKLHYAPATTVLVVLGFNVVMLLLLELPHFGYVFAPDWTPKAVDRAKASVSRNWRRFAFVVSPPWALHWSSRASSV